MLRSCTSIFYLNNTFPSVAENKENFYKISRWINLSLLLEWIAKNAILRMLRSCTIVFLNNTFSRHVLQYTTRSKWTFEKFCEENKLASEITTNQMNLRKYYFMIIILKVHFIYMYDVPRTYKNTYILNTNFNKKYI